MKKLIEVFLAVICVFVLNACEDEKKTENPPSFASLEDFYAANGTASKIYTINAATGGSFTTLQGTMVTVPANAFVDQNNNAVTGNVNIHFKDIYKKSDIVLNQLQTMEGTFDSRLMKSAGMFFIKAMYGNVAVQLAAGHKISVQQPLFGLPVDTAMIPMFTFSGDSLFMGWFPNKDTLTITALNYIYDLYRFNSPLGSGSWLNTDNPTFFSAYSQTPIVLHPLDSFSSYKMEVYLLFKDVNAVVHISYDNGNNGFNYRFAPIGMECTAVSFGVKDGKLYASFTPIVISDNLSLDFSLSETTTEAFKANLESLNE